LRAWPKLPESLRAATETNTVAPTDPAIVKPKRIESYGVANPISEVLDRLKIDLLV
jgi:hypothetical protein